MNLINIINTNSQILTKTADELGIKVELLDEEKLKLRLTKAGKTHTVTKKSFGINNSQAIRLTRNKKKVTELLSKHSILIPKELEISSLKELETAILPPFPLVLKPSEGQKAHDVYVGIKDMQTLKNTAKKLLEKLNFDLSNPLNAKRSTLNANILIQEYIKGQDTRLFVLNKKVIAVALRHPPTLTGNGKNTIEELILNHNQMLLIKRQKIGRRMQNRLLNQQRITWHIENQGLQMSTILEQRKTIEVYPISNFQAGGTAETIPVSKVLPSIIKLAEQIANLTGLKVAGIDMIIKRSDLLISRGPTSKHKKPNAYFIEINSDPSLRLHHWPNKGKPQNVTNKLLNYIFKN